MPPLSPTSLVENIKFAVVDPKVQILYRIRRVFDMLEEVKESNPNLKSLPGPTMRVAHPYTRFYFTTADYQLTRLILAGDTKLGTKEAEKPSRSKVLNFINPSVYNMVSRKTADLSHKRARQQIAPAFSKTNLFKTWPFVKGVIADQISAFEALSAKNKDFDIKEVMTLFFLRTLSKGAYGIEFTCDGTENDSTINGLEYLEEQDILAREGAKGIANPFRAYMFWDEGVQRGKLARERLHRIAKKIVQLHQDKKDNSPSQQQEPGNENTGSNQAKPVSVLDHVMAHQYGSTLEREADVNIFNFAATDTTTFTLCFLLIELARHPQIKDKLQQALAQVMPARTNNISSVECIPSLAANEPGSNELTTRDKELLTAVNGVEYLGWCIQEIMRLWPVTAGGPSRELTEDLEYNRMLLPKGSLVNCHFFSIFRQAWIDRPEEFVPERWADSNPQLPQLREMLIPFSLGKRSCIGQNMATFHLRIVAAHFLHYYDFELVDEPQFEYFITLKPYQTRMKVKSRGW